MTEQDTSARTFGDLESEHHANLAYQRGAWLKWTLNGRDNPSLEEEVLLSGQYDDRALDDVGLDGTVLAQDKQIFEGRDTYGDFSRALAGEQTPGEVLKSQLHNRHMFYTSPVVRERARLLSNEPIYVEDNPANVLLYFNGWQLADAGGNVIEQQPDDWGADLNFILPEGKRLIIDNIPKGSKYDTVPYTEEEPLVRAQIQIYHNGEGYLVADKVVGGEIRKKHSVTLKSTADPRVVEIDMDAPEPRAMDSLWPSNDRKTEWVDPLNPDNKHVKLISTTAEWAIRSGSYDNLEITVGTPNDAQNTVEVEVRRSDYLPEYIGPIIFRLVEDTGRTIAHDIYQ